MINQTELSKDISLSVAYKGMLETFPRDFFRDKESGLSKLGVMIEYYANKDVYWTARVELANTEKEKIRAENRVAHASTNLSRLKQKYYN